jgi:hypothetical protein
MRVNGGSQRPRARPRQRDDAVRAAPAAPRAPRQAHEARGARVAAILCALLLLAATGVALLATSAPARADDDDDDEPAQLTVIVAAPQDGGGPRPVGRVRVAGNGRELSPRLGGGIQPLTSVVRLTAHALWGLGAHVTIGYSGDRSYEPSFGVAVTLSRRTRLTIVARPRDRTAPAIEILSPADGVRYARGEAVAASYSCEDPNDRSPVTTCDGPVASGDMIDTSAAGSFSFTVHAQDALGNASSQTVAYEVADDPPPPAANPAPAPPAAPPAPPDAGAPPVAAATAAVAPAPPAPAPASTRAGSLEPPGAPAPPAESTPEPQGAPAPAASAIVPAAPAPAQAAPSARAPRPPPRPAKRPVAPRVAAEDPVTPSRVLHELVGYDPRSEPEKTIGILVAAFTLLQLGAGRRGLALARGGGGVGRFGASEGASQPSSGPGIDFDYEGVDVEFLGAGLGAVALGDRSRTWSWPGTRALDALGAALPVRLARRSPLLARVVADGTYLRAILGSASLLGPVAAVALGVAALHDTGGDALAPAVGLTVAIAVLGVLDAAAGLVAVLIFAIGVLVLGGVGSDADARLMLGLSALWFVVPVLAGAARPLRRPPTRSLEQSWDRAADFVIASLIGAWAVQKIVLALPGLGGVRLPIAAHANTAALCVLAALVARLAFETIASHLYPRRLDAAEAAELPEPGALQRLAASALRTALFVFFARIAVGASWQLWVGAALFVTPQVLAVFEERFPNSPRLFRALPKGLLELVLMLFVATAVGALLLSTMNERSETFIANSFVLLSLPGFLLSLLSLFGREGDERRVGWGKRVAGIALLVAGIMLVLGLLL